MDLLKKILNDLTMNREVKKIGLDIKRLVSFCHLDEMWVENCTNHMAGSHRDKNNKNNHWKTNKWNRPGDHVYDLNEDGEKNNNYYLTRNREVMKPKVDQYKSVYKAITRGEWACQIILLIFPKTEGINCEGWEKSEESVNEERGIIHIVL